MLFPIGTDEVLLPSGRSKKIIRTKFLYYPDKKHCKKYNWQKKDPEHWNTRGLTIISCSD